MLVVIPELGFSLHDNALDSVNASSGNVQVMLSVTSLRNFSKKHKQQIAQEGTK